MSQARGAKSASAIAALPDRIHFAHDAPKRRFCPLRRIRMCGRRYLRASTGEQPAGTGPREAASAGGAAGLKL